MINRRQFYEIIFLILLIAFLAATYVFSDRMLHKVTQGTLRSSTETSHGDVSLFASNLLSLEIVSLLDLYKVEKFKPNWSKSESDWSAFKENPEYVGFEQKIRDLFYGTDVLKLKIYADDSITIFSTDPSQVGEEKAEIVDVTYALRGSSSSQFSYRESFLGMSGMLSEIEVVSSYHPLFTKDSGIIGVVEVYSDRSSDFVKSEKLITSQMAILLIFLTAILTLWIIKIIFHKFLKYTD